MKNYYAILEVPVGCSLEEIRQAYRRLVQENLDNEAAFADLKEAYEALTTPARRAEYDMAAWGETFSAGGPAGSAASGNGSVRFGRCPMGAEAQCPVLQARLAPNDKYCPECGYLLSAMNSGDGFALPGTPDPAKQARLEERNGQAHTLRPGPNMVGRESADVLLPDKTVSRQHARLELGDDGGVTLEDLSSTNGTQVNDDLLVPHIPRQLTNGDQVRFGSILTTLYLPESPPEPSSPISALPPRVEIPLRQEDPGEIRAEPPATLPARARVVDMHGEEAWAYPLAPGVTTFGRRLDNSVVIQGDPYVSGSHAQIIAEEDVFRLTDVGSTNGTLLNGVRLGINEPVTLSPGDIILIGGTALRFEPVATAALEAPEAEMPQEEMPQEEMPEADAQTQNAPLRVEG